MMHDGQNQLKCTQLNTQQAGRQHDRPELVLSSLCGGKYFVSRINFRPHQGLKENFPRESLKLTRSSKGRVHLESLGKVMDESIND